MVVWSGSGGTAGGIQGRIFDPRTGRVDWPGGTGNGWFRGTDCAAGDTLTGAKGNDPPDRRAGDATLPGKAGRDNLIGGAGAEPLRGGLDAGRISRFWP